MAKSSAVWLATLTPEDIPVSPSDHDQLRFQTDQILANPAAAELLAARVDTEFNIRFTHNGHACRCRVDGATDEVFYDLKTTRDQDPAETFVYACRDWKYELQAAFYGLAAVAAGWPQHRLQFIATSNTPPHHCAVMRLPHEVIRYAERRVGELLRELEQRRSLDWWAPRGYGEVIEMPSKPFLQGRPW